MKRLLLVAASALAFAAFAAGAAASSGLRVSEVKGPGFPVRTFVLSLPSSLRLSANDVTVTENGASVADPTLVPASEAGRKTFGVVLALDTSWSMKGKPLEAAFAAAQAFVAHRNPNEQVGVVVFNRTATTILPLTASGAKISAALASQPKISTGTHIFDAVGQAETMLSRAGISSGSIVVLSDGADTGSAKTIAQVARQALASKLRIYTIGLDDKSYRPGTLKALAAAGHGEYVQAKAQALAPLFDRLGRAISNEYLLRYKSLAGPDVAVHVNVTVNGIGTANLDYRTPTLSVAGPPAAPYHPSVASRIWGSTITMVVLALLAAAVVAFLVIVLLQPRRSSLPARMAEFVSIRRLQRDGGRTEAPAEVDDTAERKGLWRRFEVTLELADIKTDPELIVVGTFVATVLSALLLYVGTGSPWWSLLALAVPLLVREWVLRTLKRRRDRFAEQLPDALQVVASALRTGHSFAGALAVVVESASEPMRSEMQRVVADEQLGIPIQNSLGIVAERMDSRDVEQLALVAQLQREAGGDAAEVIDRVAETVRERFDLKRLINTLTMQGRMSRWIVSALPIVVVLAVELENPHYLHPLTHSIGGKIVIGLAVALAIAGSLVIKRIIEIEV